MNRNKGILIGTTIAAGAAALFYLLRKKRKTTNQTEQVPAGRSRHRINTFAKAKKYIPD
jgi:hypothetical protein